MRNPKSFKEEKQEVQGWQPPGAPRPVFAKKDFVIHQNGYHRDIKTGDDISDVPVVYLENLKTEGVI